MSQPPVYRNTLPDHLFQMYPLLKRTLTLIQLGHAGQLYNGHPYWHHPVRVAMRLESLWVQNEGSLLYSALLHDLIEDTSLEVDDLKEFGYSDTVVKTVKALTHDAFDTRTYMEYVQDITIHPESFVRHGASLVKLADLTENVNGARFLPMEKRGRMERYGKAISVIQDSLILHSPWVAHSVHVGELDAAKLEMWFGHPPAFL